MQNRLVLAGAGLLLVLFSIMARKRPRRPLPFLCPVGVGMKSSGVWACLVLMLVVIPASAQWQNLNPGGGGQIQDIILDPNTPGRAYWCSDMEGAYRSDDGGASWSYIGTHLSRSNTLTLAVEPRNSNRLYAGNVGGIDVSNDGGATWNAAPGLDGQPIMAIAINPRDTSQVVAAISNRWRWDERGRNSYGRVRGERGVYVSDDRGKSWNYRVFEPQTGRRDTFTLNFSPDGKSLWVGARAGLYRSDDSARTFQKIAAPDGAGECWGATLSPDGSRVWAFYAGGDGASRLFSRASEGGEWRDEFARANFDPARFSQGQSARPQTFWLPRVDSRSTPGQTRLIFAAFSARNGLFEFQSSPEGARISRVFFAAQPHAGGFDSGWEEYLPRPLAYDYAPLSWPKRAIWTTGDQTLFAADDADAPGWERSWRPLYTQFVREAGGKRFYQTRGAQSTFLFGATASGDYVVQSNADNGVLESYDGGKSWTIGLKAPRSNAVVVVPSQKIVLAHTSSGFGAAAQNGTLWLKHLTPSPRDTWKRVGGGRDEAAGLPDTLYNQIAPDPNDARRVFIGTQTRGLWLLDEVQALQNGTARARDLTAGTPLATAPINDKGSGIAFDPNQKGVIYLAARREIWRGDETGGAWNWTRLRRGTDGTVHVLAADMGGKTRLIASVQARGGPNGAVGDGWFEISDDGGQNWRRWLDFSSVAPLRRLNWYRAGEIALQPAGASVTGNRLFFGYGNWETGRAYGWFEADLTASAPKPRDMTGNLPYAWAIGSQNFDGALLLWTRGCGLWRLPLTN